MAERKVCLAAIAGAHGVKGLVRLKSFTAVPEDVAAYGPLTDEAGRVYRLTVKGRAKDGLIADVDGLTDREAAQALKGTRLYVERDALPPPEDEEEFYHVDLIGLAVEDASGQALGRVAAVEDHGAGAVLEVRRPDGGTLLLPFTRRAVPRVDLASGRLVAAPPEEVEAKPEGEAG